MRLSVIVPVYNVEQYIVKCVKSLLTQDYDDYEIVVVDDGTPDNSIELLTENVQNDRIKIIHQENGGLSAARNFGLSKASGDYVWFFDSDDWAEEYCLADIAKQFDGCDVLYFNAHYNNKGTSQSISSYHNDSKFGRELSMKEIYYPVQYYIYRREFLVSNHLTFTPGLLHEDSMFTPIALYQADRVKPYNTPVYHQYERGGSITQTIDPKRCYDLMKVLLAHDTFVKERVEEENRYKWGCNIANSLNGLLAISIQCDKCVQNDVSSFLSNHHYLYSYLCHARKRPTRILGYLAKYNKLSIISLYKILSILRYKI